LRSILSSPPLTTAAKSPGDHLSARRDPDFDFIRDDPRFKALVGEGQGGEPLTH
jgi:hypothetical protein